ncbi:hypothetical protein [Legionella sp. WA2024007413]
MEKEKARERKMYTPIDIVDNSAHTLSKKILVNYSGNSADVFFKNFVHKTYDDHGVKSEENLVASLTQ